MPENETRPPSYTMHKNKLRMGYTFNVRLETIKILEENIASKVSHISFEKSADSLMGNPL